MMKYKIESSEKSTRAGLISETKALLYLMGRHENGNEMYYFLVDVFNDVTGMDRLTKRLWDVQSKADKNVSPKQLGRFLVTLFKNYVSDFDFVDFILFVGGVSTGVRIDKIKNVFGIENINTDAIEKIKDGLREEGRKKVYVDNNLLTDENIDCFLRRLTIVVDPYKSPGEYVRLFVHSKKSQEIDTTLLERIFLEISSTQASKRILQVIEGKELTRPFEALQFCRDIKNKEIRMLIFNKIYVDLYLMLITKEHFGFYLIGYTKLLKKGQYLRSVKCMIFWLMNIMIV